MDQGTGKPERDQGTGKPEIIQKEIKIDAYRIIPAIVGTVPAIVRKTSRHKPVRPTRYLYSKGSPRSPAAGITIAFNHLEVHMKNNMQRRPIHLVLLFQLVPLVSFILLVLTVSAIFSVPLQAAVPAHERAALIALYNATEGDRWTRNTGWKTAPLYIDGFAMPGTEGNWYGITAGTHVTLIDLSEDCMSGNFLKGSIPPEIGDLSYLTYLNLCRNQLSGTIPAALGDLINCRYLDLSDNQLEGAIPPELEDLDNLQYLQLADNLLSDALPPQLGNLAALTRLELENNLLSGPIPAALGNLVNLQILDLFNNQLSGAIPPEVGDMFRLVRLYLNNNRLSGEIPANLINLDRLGNFDIGFNCLYADEPGLRTWLDANDQDWEAHQDQCGALTVISPNSGEIRPVGSSQVITWTSTGDVGDVKIQYSADNGSSWTTISSAAANDGSYTWQLPFTLSSQYRVKISEASDSNPSDMSDGTFSVVADSTATLTVVSPNNGETWAIDSSQSITWSNTGIIGDVHIEYSTNNGITWSTIVASAANNGSYTWTVPYPPSTLCKIRISEAVDGMPMDSSDDTFIITDVSSAVPAQERDALIALYNTTNGDNWTNKHGWKTPPLDIDGFAVPGTEGSWYGVVVQENHVTRVNLYWNNLTGTIPAETANLGYLQALWLTANHLSAGIPDQLGNLANLQSLMLGENQLSGPLPGSLGNLGNMEVLNLQNNQFYGEIPDSFVNLGNITLLDMGYNCLSATNPELETWLNNHDPDWSLNQNRCSSMPPAITLSLTQLNFSAVIGGSVTAPQAVYIKNSGGGTLNWSSEVDVPWLIRTPTAASGNGTITVSVTADGLEKGTYSGTLYISDADAAAATRTVSVTLTVKKKISKWD